MSSNYGKYIEINCMYPTQIPYNNDIRHLMIKHTTEKIGDRSILALLLSHAKYLWRLKASTRQLNIQFKTP